MDHTFLLKSAIFFCFWLIHVVKNHKYLPHSGLDIWVGCQGSFHQVLISPLTIVHTGNRNFQDGPIILPEHNPNDGRIPFYR